MSVVVIMHSKIEDLAIELWLEIFSYLKIHYQFNAFFNLNKRLNQILFSYRTQINCKNNDEDTQYLFKHILPYLTQQENVTVLRLENTKNINLFDKLDMLYFPRLTKLVLHRLKITEDLLNIFQQNTTHLQYLNISSVVSGDKKTLHQLLEMIISLPDLQTCRLRMGISMSPMQLKMSSKSSMKNLRLFGMDENCVADRLSVLLQYFPCLQSLHIVANQLNFNSTTKTKNISSTAPISIFILNIKQFHVPLVQFTNFIATLTPYVQELTIICRTPLEDLTYLNYHEWISFIKSLSNLEKLTLSINRTNTIDEHIWNRNCQTLTKLMTKYRVRFQIGK